MKLPDGVKVTIGGVKYQGEIPDEICPAFLKPKPAKKPVTGDRDIAYHAAL